MVSFGYDCPHCGTKKSGFEVKSFYENKKYSNDSIFSLLVICNTCSKAMVGSFEIFDDSYGQERINQVRALLNSQTNYNLAEILRGKSIQFYPNERKQAEIPERLPDSVEEELRTAEDLFLEIGAKPHFAKPAGNAYRSTLERALCELAENDNRAKLNKRIEKLFADGKLTKETEVQYVSDV